MGAYRPLRAVLFFYECLRLLLLVVFIFLAPLDAAVYGAFFPYLVFLSPNALFPLIALFVWLRPETFRNYLSLYMAGKTISVVLFFVWELFTSRHFLVGDDVLRSLVLLGGSILINLTDILSVWGAWILNKKYRGGM